VEIGQVPQEERREAVLAAYMYLEFWDFPTRNFTLVIASLSQSRIEA